VGVRSGRGVWLAVLLVAACVGSGNASAQRIVEHDSAGRPITFDVRARGVDVGWYAGYLRRAPHGDEISSVTIRIVPLGEIERICGWGATGCYSGRHTPTMWIPAGKSLLIAITLLHEYGHHLDAAWHVPGVPEPNGTPVWWALRGIAQRREFGAVTSGYGLGWSHGIGEVFAEDYAYMQLGRGYAISWLYPPSQQLQALLRAELQGKKVTLPPPAVTDKAIRPIIVDDSGTLAAKGSHIDTFHLLGPRRRLTLTVTVAGSRGGRAAVTCNGKLVKSRSLPAHHTSTLDVRNVGPGVCRVAVINTNESSALYSYWLRLALMR
jgi:hypothetical protein